MTGSHHERASDRCAEALEIVEREDGIRFDIVVMVQGDEPLVHPGMITEAVAPMLADTSILVTNLLGRIDDDAEHQDPNCIKVVCARNGDALYFSRQPIPTRGRVADALGKQICVIPFRRDYLVDYTRLTPTPLEAAESVDMLRILEHGGRVRMVPTIHATYSVDTESDRARAESVMRDDPVYQQIFAES
jgi:3-deoxy-manno-octulosonate cytidylyltransferase (CMP-KDO synthetase)